MRKIGIGIFCIALCMAVAFIFPHLGTSYQKVDDVGCLQQGCHVAGDDQEPEEGTLHDTHTDNECSQCHDGTPGKGNVNSSSCIVCHPSGNEGFCPLVNFHDPDKGADCLICHEEDCPAGCPSKEIYGEDSVEVEVLRYVRDNVLSATPEGQEIIRLYYQLSPVVVRAMKNDEEFRKEVKEMIDGVLLLIMGEAE